MLRLLCKILKVVEKTTTHIDDKKDIQNKQNVNTTPQIRLRIKARS